MRRLAHPEGGDPALAVGASGAAGLAALLALRDDPALAGVAEAVGLTPIESRLRHRHRRGHRARTLWHEGRRG